MAIKPENHPANHPSKKNKSTQQEHENNPLILPGLDFIFMNHGHSTGEKSEGCDWLSKKDQKYIYHVSLLSALIGKNTLKGRDILEVGCGRGGNSYIMNKYFKPRSIKALDFSNNNIEFCKMAVSSSKISFLQGTALDLPFKNEQFDFVVNVESSHCYENRLTFFKEVWRTLKPGGRFLYTDVFFPSELSPVNALLAKAGFKTNRKKDVTGNVMLGLKRNANNQLAMLTGAASDERGLITALQMAYSVNHTCFHQYVDGQTVYHMWELQKKAK